MIVPGAMMAAMLKELQELGLAEKESKVYLAALEIGRATADQLAKHASIVRPTTYVQIKSLMEKGLMSTYEEGKKTYFIPESPSSLERVLLKQQEEMRTKQDVLKKLLPELSRQFESAGERPVVRFFEGKEGIKTMRELSLYTKEKKHLIIYSFEALSGLFSLQEREEYSKKRIEQGISIKFVISTKKDDFKIENPLTEGIAVPTERLPIDTDMRVFDDKLAIALFKGKPFGVLIESAGVANSFRATFNLLWEELSKK